VALQVRVKGRDEVVMSGAWERLLIDPFHGNVRELQNALVQIATVAPGPLRWREVDLGRERLCRSWRRARNGVPRSFQSQGNPITQPARLSINASRKS
jgi:transcriptional regulator with GAF, ATPase, and Fis domain